MLLQAPPEPIRTRILRLDDDPSPARFTLRVLAGAPRFTVPAAALVVVHQIGEALVPVLMGIAIERAVATGDLGQLVFWLVVLAADFAVLSFSWRFGARIAELGMLAVQHRLRTLVAEHLLLRPGSARRRAADQPGTALSLATSDVNRLSAAVEIGVYPVGQLAAVVFGGAVLLSISWPLGLAVLLGAPLLLGLTDLAGRGLRRRSGDEQEAAAAAAGQAADLMAGYRVIRGIGAEAEAEAARRYRMASRTALSRTVHARRAEGTFGGAMDLVTGLFLTAVAVAAGLMALAGAFGLGELITVIGLTQFLIDPLQNAAREAGSWWASATASSARLLELLRDEARPSAPPTRAGLPGRPGDAGAPPETSRVRETSPVTTVGALAPGEIIAIAADDASAAVVIAELRHAHPTALVAPHAAHLFAGSVLQNVALPGVAPARVTMALQAAGCEELAESLPHGYDSAVGESGSALSGGQRQRVALARALAQDAALLVLHEPTTAVDAVTEAAIADRLRAARGSGATVILSRSPALLSIADRIVRPGPDGSTMELSA